MSNIVSSAIFCARNVDKAENQDKAGRWAVAVGQGKKVFDYVKGLDNELGKDAGKAYDAITMVSKDSKVLRGVGKAINFASNNVNPLICVSSGIDVLRAKDKKSALVQNGTALCGMFAVESLMKKHLDDVVKIKGIDKVAEKVMKFSGKNKYTKVIPALIHGTVFVVGSCSGYSLGESFGNLLLGKKATAKA